MMQPDVKFFSIFAKTLNSKIQYQLFTLLLLENKDLNTFFLQKKKFDSADYFTEHEKLKEAAGLGAKKDEGEREEAKQQEGQA